ncbi:MAG: nucleoside deaminase [Candidatus Parcubacteria bacterium]|nr:nucleoside deaminase [Candidatus Parcubacteria bacterium]
MDKKKYMLAAIKAAEKGISNASGGPFGACLTQNGKVISIGYNTVLKDQNPTSHAEINAIKEACKKLKKWDLSGCEIYSTTEPCPMCFSAISWARIKKITYGTSISDVKKLGFNELLISNDTMNKLGKAKIKITKGYMLKECQSLLSQWKKTSNKKTY